MRTRTRVVAALAAVVALAGCTGEEPTMTPATQPAQTPAVPADGVSLADRGFEFAPAGLSVPADAMIVEEIDQVNNVTVVFSAPTGAELAAYYRRVLPELGFTITEDANNSLLFSDDQWDGAFTANGAYSALTLRTDWE